jgi:hypothetical protein
MVTSRIAIHNPRSASQNGIRGYMAYVVRKDIVAQALFRLREQKTHTFFAGYLCLQQRSAILDRLEDLQPDFVSFFRRFFRVNDHPIAAPYLKIFTEHKASSSNLWLNENVAGSYAPSSLRPGQPFRQVVNTEGKKYSLPSDHAQRAFQYLLYSVPVKVVDLAIVLYRDFGLIDANSTLDDLVDIFTFEFGYSKKTGGARNDDFSILYDAEDFPEYAGELLEEVQIEC